MTLVSRDFSWSIAARYCDLLHARPRLLLCCRSLLLDRRANLRDCALQLRCLLSDRLSLGDTSRVLQCFFQICLHLALRNVCAVRRTKAARIDLVQRIVVRIGVEIAVIFNSPRRTLIATIATSPMCAADLHRSTLGSHLLLARFFPDTVFRLTDTSSSSISCFSRPGARRRARARRRASDATDLFGSPLGADGHEGRARDSSAPRGVGGGR